MGLSQGLVQPDGRRLGNVEAAEKIPHHGNFHEVVREFGKELVGQALRLPAEDEAVPLPPGATRVAAREVAVRLDVEQVDEVRAEAQVEVKRAVVPL